ncbi:MULTISPECIES: IS110 family transposase [Acinetobacter]|uniref:IS110 family transposase n=2 Tax=Acinetobacter TaxID=469 RepID=A0AAP9GU54_9GAMM|nr:MULTISPECIES: IS110 family transposase [Acinetobacter]QGM26604.1 IS110 family transposase [Acinetobacter towneri]QGM27311.1 IS110 family transposase [Acinetobacter towneri]QGM28651.1 IS110 family transposase [Acinetobacter towneri]
MITLGIDVSKAKIDCCIFPSGLTGKRKTKRFDNAQSGFVKLVKWLTELDVNLSDTRAVMEATSVYHENLAHFLYDMELTICIANPARVRAFAKGLSMLNKTDKADSEALVYYANTVKLATWQPEKENVRILKALINRYAVLEEDLQREKNRLEKAQSTQTFPQVLLSINIRIQQLEQEIIRLDETISSHVNGDSELKNDLALLTTIPAVGRKTGLLMLGLLRSHRFEKASQVAAYVGLVPIHFQSGSSVNKRSRLSKAGDSKIRSSLFMPSIVALQYNPHIKALYQRLREKGKPKMLIVSAAMRKLVHLCYGVLKHQTAYQI